MHHARYGCANKDVCAKHSTYRDLVDVTISCRYQMLMNLVQGNKSGAGGDRRVGAQGSAEQQGGSGTSSGSTGRSRRSRREAGGSSSNTGSDR